MNLRKFCLLLFVVLSATVSCAGNEPLRIGVLLPLSGSEDMGWREPLDFAVENVNLAGGVAGRSIELVYVDTAVHDLNAAAQDMAEDPEIMAVIGPDTSSKAFELAPIFINAQKPMITPSATSVEIFRAFGGQRYIWRTVESDIAQVKTMLLIAKQDGIKKVALITSTDKYGTTFFDWFGFFATELGMEVTAIESFDQSVLECEENVKMALAGLPEALLVVPSHPANAVCIVRSAKVNAPGTRLIFSDAGQYPQIISELGSDAEGLDGVAMAPDPGSGFEIAWSVLFNELPPAYGANTYDALLILAYGLERSKGEGGESLAKAMEEVVDARGEKTGWNMNGIRETLAAIRSGNLPDIGGATGALDFDKDFYTDLVSSYYGHWRVDYGVFVNVEFFSTKDDSRATSISRSFASESLMQDIDSEGTSAYAPDERTGLWVLIVATSSGWDNYRHQADALAQYQIFKSNGVTDDRIILIMEDDLADNPQNAEPGVVRNVAGGPNLYLDVHVDYKLSDVNATDILGILAGRQTDRLPVVVQGTRNDNIYVFMVGHGNSGGVLIDAVDAGTIVTAIDTYSLASTISTMFQEGRYRRMFVAVEACHGGVVGKDIASPGTIFFAGANAFESSFGANYDGTLDAWLADQFAYQLQHTAVGEPDMTLAGLYASLYKKVSGSHVTAYNSQMFGNTEQVLIREFLEP